MIGQKLSTKKYCWGIKQVREAYSSKKKKKDKAVSFLVNGSEKYSSSRQSSEAEPNTNWWAENYCFLSNFTKPINETVMILIHLIISTFVSLKIIVDTLIDVENAKHQNITS